ncbi:MAG: hypothetical protein O9271_05940 [Gemmatimonas sp.]|nr:hypothetical protein [Gemmatimonas sp.]
MSTRAHCAHGHHRSRVDGESVRGREQECGKRTVIDGTLRRLR